MAPSSPPLHSISRAVTPWVRTSGTPAHSTPVARQGSYRFAPPSPAVQLRAAGRDDVRVRVSGQRRSRRAYTRCLIRWVGVSACRSCRRRARTSRRRWRGSITQDADGLVGDLMAPNLPLAGRCAVAPGVTVGDPLAELRAALVARSRDPAADLRARIDAALTLGPLGDPRFERRTGPFGTYWLPPLVTVSSSIASAPHHRRPTRRSRCACRPSRSCSSRHGRRGV